jgi:hypothetical protein
MHEYYQVALLKHMMCVMTTTNLTVDSFCRFYLISILFTRRQNHFADLFSSNLVMLLIIADEGARGYGARELSNLPVRQYPIKFGASCACIVFMREKNMETYPHMPLKINALDTTPAS